MGKRIELEHVFRGQVSVPREGSKRLRVSKAGAPAKVAEAKAGRVSDVKGAVGVKADAPEAVKGELPASPGQEAGYGYTVIKRDKAKWASYMRAYRLRKKVEGSE